VTNVQDFGQGRVVAPLGAGLRLESGSHSGTFVNELMSQHTGEARLLP